MVVVVVVMLAFVVLVVGVGSGGGGSSSSGRENGVTSDAALGVCRSPGGDKKLRWLGVRRSALEARSLTQKVRVTPTVHTSRKR